MKLYYSITNNEHDENINSDTERVVELDTVECEIEDKSVNEFISNYVAKERSRQFFAAVQSCKNPIEIWKSLQEFFREEIEDYFRSDALNSKFNAQG